MKIRECFDRVRAIPGMPNVEEDMLTVWLNECEGKVFCEIVEGREGAPLEEFEGYGEDDMEETLMVKDPYSSLYVYYLAAQVYLSYADMTRYNNYLALFLDEFEEFACFYAEKHRQSRNVEVKL